MGGIGTPDFQGMWNMPCGYLDFDETTKEAVIREVYEETGVLVPPSYLHFWSFNDLPTQNLQNVTFRYYALLDYPIPGNFSIGELGGEKDEVADIKWIRIRDIGNYQWAFNHKEIIEEFCDKFNLT